MNIFYILCTFMYIIHLFMHKNIKKRIALSNFKVYTDINVNLHTKCISIIYKEDFLQ